MSVKSLIILGFFLLFCWVLN